jgi:hypothetical protein
MTNSNEMLDISIKMIESNVEERSWFYVVSLMS